MSDVHDVRELIASCDRVAVMTGAGISAESGVPTFRGPGGLWEGHRPEELATPTAFAADPHKVWRWYDWRRGLVAQCEPNPAHHALVRLEQRTANFHLITQNVDGLHRLAGSSDPTELHGNLWITRCTYCQDIREDRRVPIPVPPTCEICGEMLRPHIVWFGESLDAAVLDRAAEATAACEIFLVVGTSGVVYPAAGFVDLALRGGATVVQVNLEPTPQTGRVQYAFEGKAGEVLPELIP
jgi:NAD-dependent deacetylase